MKSRATFAASALPSSPRVNNLDALGDLLTTEQAAARLLYTGPRAVANFFAFADRQRIPRLHRGSRVLWQADVLAAFLKQDKWTRKRAQATHDGKSAALRVVGKG